MKKFIICLTLILSYFVTYAGTEDVKNFYITYMRNVVEHIDNKALCHSFMSTGLILKLERMTSVCGVDAVLRSQDISKDAVESLSVENLGNSWYMVRYRWNITDPTTTTEIPVKAEELNGDCKITYITPLWSGTEYGDDLIYDDKNEKKMSVLQNSESEFIQSFYKTYLSAYYRIDDNIESSLSMLRSKFLSEKALQQFEKKRFDNAQDGYMSFDMIIGNFDFDYSWKDSIKLLRTGKHEYQFSYKVGNRLYSLEIFVTKQNGCFVINSISGC